MKLTTPITANLASVVSIPEPASASSPGAPVLTGGSTNDESMHAPMAAANGASCENSALKVVYSVIFLWFGNLL